MTAPRPLQGVLFGHGRMGRIHAEKLRGRAGVSLAVVDPQAGFDNPVPSDLDFAIVATPTHTHEALTTPLLDRGIPCLVEKPLSATLDQARRLSAYPHLSVGHIERFNPALGPLEGCRPRFIQAERIGPFPNRSTDIDVIDDLMIHDIDLVLRFMPGTVTDVRAIGIGVVSGQTDIVNARVEILGPEDMISVALLTASRVSRRRARQWRVVEPGVYWTIDLDAGEIQRVPWGEQQLEASPIPVPDTDPVTAEHDAFLAAVRGDGPFLCTGAEALAALELADRIRRAM
jgi:predicted dehydrogenase